MFAASFIVRVLVVGVWGFGSGWFVGALLLGRFLGFSAGVDLGDFVGWVLRVTAWRVFWVLGDFLGVLLLCRVGII